TDGAAGNGAASLSRLATSCTPGSIPGRWKRDSTGNYTWTFFPCAPPLSPPSRWISDLRRKGIEEINIVGNSHQRGLANHLHFSAALGGHGALIARSPLQLHLPLHQCTRETFRINWYWVDGIYRNGEFGCG
ncbi:unnamed protein product, partial [Closterium sp. Yama58-4]